MIARLPSSLPRAAAAALILAAAGLLGLGMIGRQGEPQPAVADQAGCLSSSAYAAELRAWWPLDDGTSWQDMAGVRNQARGRPAGVPPSVATGRVGHAAKLDGVGAHLVVSRHHELDIDEGDMTIDAWVRLDDTTGERPIVDRRGIGPEDMPRGYRLYVRDGYLGFSATTVEGSHVTALSRDVGGPRVVTGTWHFVAVSVDRDPGSAQGGALYLDGTELLRFDVSGLEGDIDPSVPLVLGSHNRVSRLPVSAFLSGVLDEVELYGRAMSTAELQAIYAAGPRGKCRPAGAQAPQAYIVGGDCKPGEPCGTTQLTNVTVQNGCGFTATGFSFVLGQLEQTNTQAGDFNDVNGVNYPLSDVFEARCDSMTPWPHRLEQGTGEKLPCNPFTPLEAVPDYDDGAETITLRWSSSANNADVAYGKVTEGVTAHFGYTLEKIDLQGQPVEHEAVAEYHVVAGPGTPAPTPGPPCRTTLPQVNVTGMLVTATLEAPQALVTATLSGEPGAVVEGTVLVSDTAPTLAELVEGSTWVRRAQTATIFAGRLDELGALVIPVGTVATTTRGVVVASRWPDPSDPNGSPMLYHMSALVPAAPRLVDAPPVGRAYVPWALREP